MKKKQDSKLPPKEHWEFRYNMSKPNENMIVTQGSDFIAKQPSVRKTTHLKVNKEDY